MTESRGDAMRGKQNKKVLPAAGKTLRRAVFLWAGYFKYFDEEMRKFREQLMNFVN